ncbi:MAG: carotenoid oxygenase family protein [Microthrixaceae bacterium]
MNHYLQGNFGPVAQELTAQDLPVTGSIPETLDGRYLRNGPNPLGSPDPDTYHWFTGDGMVHGIRIQDGRALWYRNRWVRAGSVPELLGEDDPGGPITPGADFAANTNVIGFGGRTFAIVEAGAKPVELTDELSTIARCDFDGTLPNGFTAHPKVDPISGEIHAAAYYWGRPELLEYLVIGTDGLVKRREDLPVPGNPMVHDMSITEKYAVFYDLPVTFDIEGAMAGSTFPYAWNPAYGARLGVLPRRGAGVEDVRWFDIEPCYVFHPMNAYDDVGPDGHELVVLDVVRHERVFDKSRLAPDESLPTLWRWTIDLTSGTVKETQLDDFGCEFPRVDERLVGRRHRYGFALSLSPGGEDTGGVNYEGARIHCRDADSGSVRSHEVGAGRAAGETVFIPSSEEAQGLDGYLMTLVYDANVDTSELWILAADDIEAEPLAKVHLPQRVPFGFHGNWVPS